MKRKASPRKFSSLSQPALKQVALAVLVTIVAIPLSTQAIVRLGSERGGETVEKGGRAPNVRSGVRADRTSRREQRKMYDVMKQSCGSSRATAEAKPFCKTYWEAVDRCLSKRNLKTEKVDMSCPDINDHVLVQAFRQTEEGKQWVEKIAVAALHKAAPEDTVKPLLRVEDLSPRVRAALRAYVRMGECPDHLHRVPIEGFYELCLSLIGFEGAAPEVLEEELPMSWEEFFKEVEAFHRRTDQETTVNERLRISGKARPDR